MSNKSLEKFCRILESFTPSEPTWTATDLAAKLKVPVTTLHGILVDLAEKDFLFQSPTSKEFRLGFRYLEMGYLHANNFELNNIAHGVMRDLVAKVNRFADLSVMYKGWMYVAMTVLTQTDIGGLKYVGPRLPAHATAGGKMVLSYLTAEERAKYCTLNWEGQNLVPECALEKLEEEVKLARSRGYAVGHPFGGSEEPETIAVPILGRNGQILAALVLHGPIGGFTQKELVEVRGKLLYAAGEISMRCGHISANTRYVC